MIWHQAIRNYVSKRVKVRSHFPKEISVIFIREKDLLLVVTLIIDMEKPVFVKFHRERVHARDWLPASLWFYNKFGLSFFLNIKTRGSLEASRSLPTNSCHGFRNAITKTTLLCFKTILGSMIKCI